MTSKPFRVSDAYIEWAYGSAAEEGQPLAIELVAWPTRGRDAARHKLFEQPVHVAEIADVAELYVGGRDTNLRAAGVHARAVKWLRERGLSVRQLVAEAHVSKDSRLR